MIEPKPAATVMIVRDDGGSLEVYLVRRSARSAFVPDAYVFPGGRVDEGDGTPGALARLRGSSDGADRAHLHAAVRETFEEAGLLFAATPVDVAVLASARERLLTGARTFAAILDELQTDIDAAALRYFSRWITPPGETRRFDTHFFVARAPAGQTARADARETHDGRWIAPADALDRFARGDFALILPTIKHLERLRAFGSVDELLSYAAAKPIHPVMPDAGQGAHTVPAALEGVW